MAQGLLLWSPCNHSVSLRLLPRLPFLKFTLPASKISALSFLKFTLPASKISALSVSATMETTAGDTEQLTAREKRRLRNERRESKATNNWREEVEERLCKKPKKEFANWTEKLNLDYLAKLGPQWWVFRVARVRALEIVERVARALVRNFPDLEFKIYYPSVQEKRKLKNGTLSVKPKPIFPGSVFIWCIMNKEMHDFIREVDGVGGFVGSIVGNTKRQINKPKPVSAVDMEVILKQAKDEQEKIDRAFEEEEKGLNLGTPNDNSLPHTDDDDDDTKYTINLKPKALLKKALKKEGSNTNNLRNLLVPGTSVRVVSGTFSEFEGNLKKLNRRTGKASVGFTIFGKETIVDLDVNDLVLEAK